MEKYEGRAIFQRVAIGRIWYYTKEEQSIKRCRITDKEAEWQRYQRARQQAVEELKALYEKAQKEVGEVNAAIFEVHAMMLEDDDYNASVRNMIESQEVNAEYAVASTGDNFFRMFSEMEDDYFQARAADIRDISDRVVAVLSHREKKQDLGTEPVIIAAEDLAPSETVQMDKDRMLGFVTELGSANSHTAILARTMNIPALIGIPVKPEWNGRMAVIDGYHGILYLDPDDKTLEQMSRRQQEDKERARLLEQMKNQETVTRDGRKIHLYANIGNPADVASVLENDAEGIGLFRSEFLYLERESWPTEEEQFQSYKLAAEMMAGKKVIIRTLDIGADKQAAYFGLEHEENPAMGYRAIRICLEQPEIFRTQLRAIFRAGAYGRIAVMYPMITSVEEVRRIKQIAEEVQTELRRQGIPCGCAEQGIMIETPAAALISDLLAKEVDFFSIGTNDLSQYTLAIDRQNSRLDSFFDPHHPAILRLIRTVIENGHKEGCWVGICGELAADLELTEAFLDMGIDELSVAPGMVLAVREAVRKI
ncbi:MAG: phosphoenolpyruvate--protein phosphotransferase [Lachnospiraceae bacterium]|nr:phosphoenolpyruvate--protein phosphotransferase [Lachnospiraceae bacterium]